MITVKLDTKELDRIIRDSGLKAAQVVNKLAYQVEARAKQFAPVDTGALMNSGFTDPATATDPTATVGFTVDYAAYQEFGTWKMGAQPYLTPAVETIISQFQAGETWKEVVK